MNYKLLYKALFGGITQITGDKFTHVNGYPNNYWGWGGEDDDMYRRVFKYGKYTLVRPPANLARYKMITHAHESANKPNPDRFSMLKQALANRAGDGIAQLEYRVEKRVHDTVFERVIVDIGDKPKRG